MKYWVNIMIIMVCITHSEQTPRLVVNDTDVQFDTKLYHKQRRRFRNRVKCWKNQECFDKYNCEQLDNINQRQIVNEIVHMYRPSRHAIKRWGREVICNKYNSPTLCFSTIKPRIEQQMQQLSEVYNECMKSHKTMTRIMSDVNITSIGNNVKQKCEFNVASKTAECKGLVFNIGYNITEKLKHVKPIYKYIRLNLSCDSSYDLVYYQGDDSCGMQQTQTKTKVINMPFQTTNRKERRIIRKMAKLAGLFAATEIGVRSNLTLVWSSNSTV